MPCRPETNLPTESLNQGSVSPLLHPPAPAALEPSQNTIKPSSPLILNKNLIDLAPSTTPVVMSSGAGHTTIYLNPPDVQWVVVEHVMHSSESLPLFTTPGKCH